MYIYSQIVAFQSETKHDELNEIGMGAQRLFEAKYNDVIMSTMASQITGVSIVCSTVGSGADQRKH